MLGAETDPHDVPANPAQEFRPEYQPLRRGLWMRLPRTTTSTPARASRNPSIIPAGPPPAMQHRTCSFSAEGDVVSILILVKSNEALYFHNCRVLTEGIQEMIL